ncbi:hypothetical protein KAT82_03260 [bacterium]|nr:hypothetical protein [bacterium]
MPLTRTARKCMVRREPVAKEPGEFEMRIDVIEANAGDTIHWEVVDNHAISIWFPGAGVFVTPVIAVMHVGPVEATIRDDAPGGEYEYAIYDHTEGQFVTCQSHPKIEIPKP